MPRPRATTAALLLALTLPAGCSLVGGDDGDKGATCATALDAAGFVPDLSDPAGAVAAAKGRADELRTLADQTSDADLQRELRETADKLATLEAGDVNPVDSTQWAGELAEQVDQLHQACQ